MASLFYSALECGYDLREGRERARDAITAMNRELSACEFFLSTFGQREFFWDDSVDRLYQEVSPPAAIERALCMLEDSNIDVIDAGLCRLIDSFDELREAEYRFLRQKAAGLLLVNDAHLAARAQRVFKLERHEVPVAVETDEDRRWRNLFAQVEGAAITGPDVDVRRAHAESLCKGHPLVGLAVLTLCSADTDPAMRRYAISKLCELEPEFGQIVASFHTSDDDPTVAKIAAEALHR
jgi:hypothetical protein